MIFFLGAKSPSWLEQTSVPLFVTYSTLVDRVSLPRALGPWALDPNGFESLRLHGRYPFSAKTYAAHVRRYQREIGGLVFASVMDWMCEAAIRYGGRVGRLTFKGTGLSVREHQTRTIDSYIELCSLAPEVPWLPVLQGSGAPEYMEMLDEYDRRGIDLRKVPRVGVGSICRRQASPGVTMVLLPNLIAEGLTLHAFGFKKQGVEQVVAHLEQWRPEALESFFCDSMAWSFDYRFSKDRGEQYLKNRIEGALAWRACFLASYEARGLMTELEPRTERWPGVWAA